MYRRALTRLAPRCINHAARTSYAPATCRLALLPRARFAPAVVHSVRCYAASSGLKEPEVLGRIMDILKNFDKVTKPEELTAKSSFANDLGLDSLDIVEVVMAVEEEFSIEIPDKEADAITSIDQAVSYIMKSPDGEHTRYLKGEANANYLAAH